MMIKNMLIGLSVVILALMTGCSQKQDTIKLGYIDPLSGPFANIGEHVLRELQFFVKDVNDRGGVLNGVKFEIVSIDGKFYIRDYGFVHTTRLKLDTKCEVQLQKGSVVDLGKVVHYHFDKVLHF